MTRFRMVLVVVGSALLFTFVGPFLYRAVGADSPVGTCSPVGNNSPVGDNSSVGNNSPVGSCSPVGTQAPTRIFNSLSGGGETGPVITVDPNTPVTDHAMLRGDNISSDPATVTYTVYSLHSSDWQWGWDKVASGGTVTVTGGVVPASQAVTLGSGVYLWKASYSGDANNAPSTSRRGPGIEIVRRPFECATGDNWWSVRCFQHSHQDDNGNGGQGYGGDHGNGGQGQGDDNGGGNNYGNQGQGNDHGNGNNDGNQGQGNDHGNGGQGYDNGWNHNQGNGNGWNNGGQGDDHGDGGSHGWVGD